MTLLFSWYQVGPSTTGFSTRPVYQTRMKLRRILAVTNAHLTCTRSTLDDRSRLRKQLQQVKEVFLSETVNFTEDIVQ
jgi:hypothetical protein